MGLIDNVHTRDSMPELGGSSPTGRCLSHPPPWNEPQGQTNPDHGLTLMRSSRPSTIPSPRFASWWLKTNAIRTVYRPGRSALSLRPDGAAEHDVVQDMVQGRTMFVCGSAEGADDFHAHQAHGHPVTHSHSEAYTRYFGAFHGRPPP